MKERTPEQLKGQVKNFANKRSLMPQEVLQIFFMESLLFDIKMLEKVKIFYFQNQRTIFTNDSIVRKKQKKMKSKLHLFSFSLIN